MSERSRFRGTASEVRDVVAPFVTSVTWLCYAEQPGQQIDRVSVQKHWPMLEALAKLQPNLCFNQSLVEAVFEQIAEDRKEEWSVRLYPSEWGDWAKTMARRLRCMCRHTQQAGVKNAAWLEKLKSADTEKRDDSVQVTLEGFHGWDQELQKAWRQLPGRAREYTTTLEPQGDAADSPMAAKFEDGEVRPLTELTKQDWSHMVIARGLHVRVRGKTPGSMFWEGEHAASGLQVTVRPRADRTLLMAMSWDKRMICMVKVGLFVDQKAAFEFMVRLAERFCSGELLKTDLYKARDEELRVDLGVAPSQTQTLKRPAGAKRAPQRLKEEPIDESAGEHDDKAWSDTKPSDVETEGEGKPGDDDTEGEIKPSGSESRGRGKQKRVASSGSRRRMLPRRAPSHTQTLKRPAGAEAAQGQAVPAAPPPAVQAGPAHDEVVRCNDTAVAAALSEGHVSWYESQDVPVGFMESVFG